MLLRGLAGVMLCMKRVRMSAMRVVGSLLMGAGRMMCGGFLMMLRGMLVMLGRFGMMFLSWMLFGHVRLPVCRIPVRFRQADR